LQQRGHLATAADAAIARLVSLNYLNDDAFARNWALSRAQTSSYGPGRIERELKSKGVGQSIARDALRATFEQVDEASQARRLLTKRFKGEKLNEDRIARRAAAFLQRRGYGSKVIFDLLRYHIDED
jgi:regulatory protein